MLNIKLPKHKCGLYITHNQHKDVYQTVSDYISDCDERTNWKSESSKKKAIETDEIWEIQWYPNTPIGFYSVAAPTLEEALDFAIEVEREVQGGE